MKDPNNKLFKAEYRDKWVALESKSGKVVGVGATAKIAYEESQKNGVSEPVLTRIPKNYGSAYILNTF